MVVFNFCFPTSESIISALLAHRILGVRTMTDETYVSTPSMSTDVRAAIIDLKFKYIYLNHTCAE